MKKHGGFTLLELILVVVLSSVIFAVASKMLAEGFKGYLTGKNLSEADDQVRVAIERMTREMRLVRSSNDITAATATQFSFVDTYGNSISFTLSGTNLMRNSQILASGVQSLTFSYSSGSGAVTAVISAIRYVNASLNITLNNTNYTIASGVYLRNLS